MSTWPDEPDASLYHRRTAFVDDESGRYHTLNDDEPVPHDTECAALYTVLYASVTAGATDTTQPGDEPLESSFQPDDGSNCATSFTPDPDTGTDAEKYPSQPRAMST